MQTLRDQIDAFLLGHWYLYPWLNPAQRDVVLRFTETFCDQVQFYYSAGIDNPEALSWLVGASAAVVGGAQRTACFSVVKWVYLLDDDVLQDDRSGEAQGFTTVRLNAEDLHFESVNRIPGQQIAVHEFAHVLDAMFGISDSTPGLREGLELHLSHRREGLDDGIPDDVVRAMIEEDSGLEFFAYMSELFFTDPHGVIDFYPPLYEDLVKIYGLDLARQLPDMGENDMTTPPGHE